MQDLEGSAESFEFNSEGDVKVLSRAGIQCDLF